jgi:hypothetical protein
VSHIEERLARARRSRLVGREAERTLLRNALEASELPFCLLHIHGPGGIGKTTLLQSFRDLCADAGVATVPLDARHIEPSPDAFLAALCAALNIPPGEDPFDVLEANDRRRVLLVDTYETLDMLDGWIREAFVPRLPANTLVVLAGRTPLAAGWRTDMGWQSLVRTIGLRNFSPVEARAYLTACQVPSSQHNAALEFTHGHPLALSLVADVFAQRAGASVSVGGGHTSEPGNDKLFPNGETFDPDVEPAVVQELLDRLILEVPGGAHRTALEACAVVRVLDEALLAEMLKDDGAAESAPDLFQWLRSLSFMEMGNRGVFPHDVVREALLSDLRWRNRLHYVDLHRRAREYYTAHLRAADGIHQQSMLYDCVFLHRDNAVVRAAFTWQEEQIFPDTLRPSDHEALVAMVARHEGEESAKIARRWLERQPDATLVFRSVASAATTTTVGAVGEPVGFLTMLDLQRTEEADREADPAGRAAWDYLKKRHAPLRAGEAVAHLRFWMADKTYQAQSPVQSLIIVNALRQFLTRPRLAYTFFACGNADDWESLFGYVDIPRLAEAEFTVGGRRYGVFGRDWREIPATLWLARLAEKETHTGSASPPAEATPAVRPQPSETMLVVLSEAEFQTAVRNALRDYTNDTGLRRNPLIRSPLVASRAGANADAGARVTALRTLLNDTAQAFNATPRLARAYRALHHTYFQPCATQEQAAELLDLPFSTYRRHLGEGIAELSRALWQKETGDAG